MAGGCSGIQVDRVIASTLDVCNLATPWSPWVYATDASGRAHGGYGATRRWCDPGMRRRQGALQNGGGFRRKNLSALDDQPWSNLSWKLKKPLGLESRLFGKLVVLTCILLWLVTCGKVFIQRLLSSKMCHRPSFSPSLPGAS